MHLHGQSVVTFNTAVSLSHQKKLDKKKGIKKTKVTPFFRQKQYKNQSEKKNWTKKEEKEGGTED